MANGTGRIETMALLLLLSKALLGIEGVPRDLVTHAPPESLVVEARAHKQQDQDALDVDVDVDEDLDGRSAYVNNQYVPSEPIDMIHDEQNAPLYEILQKQMEQVLAATGPDVPIYEDDKSKRQRNEQLPNKPLFDIHNNNNNDAFPDEDYVDETPATAESEQGYVDAEKPDAAVVEEQVPEAGYQMPELATTSSSSIRPTDSTTTKPHLNLSTTTSTTTSSSTSTSTTRSRPHRRRTTTTSPRTTRHKNNTQYKVTTTTPSSVNHTEWLTSTTTPAISSIHRPRPNSKPSSNPIPTNVLPHDPQIYQHKRRIIFKTISTGSQFVNSPIGDLMIKFSIGYAKPAQGVATPTNEALRALSNSLLRSIESQKLKRVKVQKDK